MNNFLLTHRRWFVFALHVVSASVIYWFAFILRFEGDLDEDTLQSLLTTLPWLILIKLITFNYFGLHKGLWRYAGIDDLKKIVKACTVSTLVIVTGITLYNRFQGFPRSVLIIDWALSILVFGGKRFSLRIFREYRQGRERGANDDNCEQRILIAGAGDAGEMALRELCRNEKLSRAVIGFLDDSPHKQGMTMHGYRVLGNLADAQKIIKKHQITELLIAMPSAPKSTVRKLVDDCSDENVKFRILPAMADIITGRLTVQHIRDVEVEDLLGREPISLDRGRVLEEMRGKCVLVTGAGGSIGAELARQIAGYNPRHLLLLDMGETPLFEIDREIAELAPNIKRTAIVCDVKKRQTVQDIFQTYRPNLVFHAAAYKHVPLMEDHPNEAVANNILGTRNLAETAVKYETEKFVMISTDKAVRPTNVMGATKRCAELLVNALNQNSKTAFASVRFGNVLGSNGSVVPIFKKQIKNEQPIKITHPDITRYFMTIPEAVELVLQAGTICSEQGGEVFILDMGEPIKIVDLARNLIKLSGLREGEDIDIVYTGLRPGEKLYEELIAHGEDVELTEIPKIMVHRRNGSHANNDKQILEQLTNLIKLTQTQDAEKTRTQLWQTLCQNDPDIPQNQ